MLKIRWQPDQISTSVSCIQIGALVSVVALPPSDHSRFPLWTVFWNEHHGLWWSVRAACALSRGRATVWAPIYPAVLTLCCSPLSLHMEEGGRSFVVWWRCVLTQRGDEDGILIGLIELMVLSPLVGEECQASLWRCAGWLLSAFCSCTPAPIWTLCFRLCVLFSVSSPCCLSSPLSFTVFLSFYTAVWTDKRCFDLHSTHCTFVANVFCSFSYWFHESGRDLQDFIFLCPCSSQWLDLCLCVCVRESVCMCVCECLEAGRVCLCVIMEGWHLKQCI